MESITFEEFINKVFRVVENFAAEHNANITIVKPDQEREIYIKGESIFNEGNLYYIETPIRKKYYIRLFRNSKEQRRLYINGRNNELFLNENLERISKYPYKKNTIDIDDSIGNITGDFEQRLKACLEYVW
ncbi:MAG: hypothetical protein H7Y18_07315 [Clostridiaceae bacterium]|nr:hypothetical protein [Clostridiaceae bacterium]